MIIGVTGPTGSGKGEVSKYLKSIGFIHIDFDVLSRDVQKKGSPCLKEITDAFGMDIIDTNGNLKRQELGKIVFSSKEKLNILNAITHKYILKKADEIISRSKNSDIILDAPLLFEANLNKKCDYTLSVLAKKEIRLERIIKRDNLSKDDALKRIESQNDDNFYIEKSDFFVYNNDDKNALLKFLDSFIRRIKK